MPRRSAARSFWQSWIPKSKGVIDSAVRVGVKEKVVRAEMPWTHKTIHVVDAKIKYSFF
jgi:hypothetical protein